MLLVISFSLDNITSRELGVAVMGLLIVFTALVLISGFIAILPRIMDSLQHVLPPEGDHHHGTATPAGALDDEVVAVAIGVALHARMQNKSTE
ncbi:MAG: hypothetical protein CMJ64_05920 [Planctomycetaceae bacterium]|nr:hypothetical protein [Planctomycetaceae bacterium]